MWARILGSAAGGGFPQWNCACRHCAGARTGTLPVRARTQASLAVSADRQRWYLVNATPDIGSQLARLGPAASLSTVFTTGRSAVEVAVPHNGVRSAGRPPSQAARRSPIAAVLLTDAELDHATGLLSLREGDGLAVYATAAVLRAAAPLLDLLAAYQPVERRELTPGVDVPLDDVIAVRAVPTGSTKLPRYAAHLPPDPAGVVGYRFTAQDSGRRLVYLPCVPALTAPLVAELAGARCALVDGTCWTDDEMATVGKPDKTSRSMGHAPVTGPGGTLSTLATLPTPRRVYTHLNNTNPLLVEDSPQRHAVEAAGVEVAHDGMEIEVP